MYVFFFKQKTAYEMRISDWSSDVCSSDLGDRPRRRGTDRRSRAAGIHRDMTATGVLERQTGAAIGRPVALLAELTHRCPLRCPYCSNPLELAQIGRASCRARGWQSV